jgi:hypothetical protein
MNKSSIFLSQNNLAGEIILEKKPNNKIMVGHSNISNIIAQRSTDVINFTSYEQIIEKIQSIIFSMCFTSRYIGMDMYDNKKYNEYEKDFKNIYIYGIQNIYDVPAGIVFYHESNELLFQCTNIEFMISEFIIPFNFTNIPANKIYLVKRSNGDIQDTCLLKNGGIFLKDDILRITNNFSSSKDEKLNPGILNDFQKAVYLDEFLKLNDLIFKVNLPYFSEKVINREIPIIQDLLNYYNTKLKEFSSKLEKYIIKN